MIRKFGSTSLVATRQFLGSHTHKNEWKQLLGNNKLMSLAARNMSDSFVWNEMKAKKAQDFLENMDEQMKQTKHLAEIEYEILLSKNARVPEHISDHDWFVLLTECKSQSARRKFLAYLSKNEHLEKRRIEMKKEAKALREEFIATKSDDFMYREQYSLHVPTRELNVRKNAAARATVFGNPIVFDFDYNMTRRESIATAFQLSLCYGNNAKHDEPFAMHFTGYRNNETLKEHFLPIGSMGSMFIQFNPESFIDLYPRERLVYLSPHAPMLKKYSTDNIYVIGGLVDLHDTSHQSSAKAKELGIRCGSLPITNYFRLLKTKILTLDCVYNIMLDMNLSYSWEDALLKNLPRRQFQHLTEQSDADDYYQRKYEHKERKKFNSHRNNFKIY